jgi:uncharacterized membrane protein
MLMLLVGLALFLLTHLFSALAPQGRLNLITRLGTGGYRIAFSLISLLGFVLIVYGFSSARAHSLVIWEPSAALKWLARGLMLLALIVLASSVGRSHLKHRIKHPQLTAVKTWSLAHLLANGLMVDILLFGTFLAWAVFTRITLKRRVISTSLAAATWQPLFLHDLIAVAVGVCAYAFFLLGGHVYLFGVNPLY